jgi:hypothetical protein
MVYDLIAKIWAESDPVYDLPAIDISSGSRKVVNCGYLVTSIVFWCDD